MIEDGYRPNARGSMAPAAMSFMRDHGVLKDIYTERDGDSHKTARGKKLSVRTVKAPGFGPKGIHRFVSAPPALHRAAGLGAVAGHGDVADPPGTELGRHDQRHDDPLRGLA